MVSVSAANRNGTSQAFQTHRKHNTRYAHDMYITIHSKTHSHTNLRVPGTTSAAINSEDNESLIRHHLHNMLWPCEHSKYYSFQLRQKAKKTQHLAIF